MKSTKSYFKMFFALFAVLGLGFLVGCGGSDEPAPAPESSGDTHSSEVVADDSEDLEVEYLDWAVEHDDNGTQLVYIESSIYNNTDEIADGAVATFYYYDEDDEILGYMDIDTPILYPGESTVIADWVPVDEGTFAYAEVEVYSDFMLTPYVDTAEVAICDLTDYEYNGDGTMTLYWDETYSGLPEDAGEVMNVFVFYDEDYNLTGASYIVGETYGVDGETSSVNWGGCPEFDFDYVDIYCYVMPF